MTSNDDLILEWLSEHQVIINKRGLEINLREQGNQISYSTIDRRLPLLEEIGLIELVRESGKWYRITEHGIKYLEGDYDVRDIEKPEDLNE